MNKTTKKRLIIAGIVLVFVVVGGVSAFHVAVNTMFSKMTQTISENDLLQEKDATSSEQTTEDDEIIGGLPKQMDAETIKALESKVSVSDKYAALSLLAKALPKEEYSKIISFASGGVTKDEFNQAMQILKENLKEEDKEKIKQYYAKYMHLLEEEKE